MDNKISERYLSEVGKGFTYVEDSDLRMVQRADEFARGLTFDEAVQLVEGLDCVLKGKSAK